jgi:hypothetical protein
MMAALRLPSSRTGEAYLPPGLALQRMNRYNGTYTKELFTQYLLLPAEPGLGCIYSIYIRLFDTGGRKWDFGFGGQ